MTMDMNADPVVSVLMPVYNGEKYLREAIDSILNQTHGDFEFIIIDDGSTDGTWAILNSYTDQRIRLVQNVDNLGHTKSLCKGLALAQGVYIARMDADDVSLPERLAKQVDFLKTHSEIGALGTGVQIIDVAGNTFQTLQFPTQHGVLKWCLCFFCPIAHPSVMLRREIVERVGGYNANMKHAEDYDLWRRLSSVTRLSNLQDVHLYLRKHDANVSIVCDSEAWRYIAQVSCLMISHILHEEVPAGTVRSLWEPSINNASDERLVAELVYRLYRAIISNGGLSTIEIKAIRQDAALRLYHLSKKWAHDAKAWRDLARAFYLNPLLVVPFAKGLLRYVIHMRPCR